MKVWGCHLAVCVAALLVTSDFAGAIDGDDPKTPSAQFKIATKKKDDTVEVRVENDKTVFVAKSPFGISQAVIERLEPRWPKDVVLRLNLKGLASFRASNGKLKLDAVASIQEGKPKVRVWKDGKEDAPLDDKNPLWLDIRSRTGTSR